MRRAFHRPLPGPLPIGHSLRAQVRLRVVVRQPLGLRLAARRNARRHHLGHTLMGLLAGAPQQGLIGGVLDQGMLETVRRLRRQPLPVQELGRDQLVQPLLHGVLVPGRDGLQQFIGELTPQGSSELRQGLHRRQAIQPRHQRVVQRGGNGQRRQGAGQPIALRPLLQQAGLQHHRGSLFHKQRHPIGLGHHLFDDLRRQHLALNHPLGPLRGVAAWQARQRHAGHVRPL
jgi:hypothetical protein